jgi:branched-chain amino acid transport system ATP-binding protein
MPAVSPMKTAPEPAADAILTLNNIEVVYDRVILVLKGVSLSVQKGGIVALLGANGAGKTTTLKAISNLLHSERGEVTKGSIVFDSAEVQALSPNEVVRRGCIQVMQGRYCFGHLTVEENLLTGAFTPATARRRSAPIWKRSMPISRACASGGSRSPATRRAASSRCARLAAR